MKESLLRRRIAWAVLTLLLGAAFVPTASAQSRGTLSSDFEDQSIPSDWNNDANRPWAITNADNHTDQGSYCLKSYSGADNATSDLEASVLSLQAGTITFWAKISSESNYDKGYFYIDDQALINGISGDGDWIEYNFDLAAGMHTLKWSYEKDGSAADNQDCFFIDDITITNVATCPSVSGIAIGNITQNSAVLSWVDNGVGNYQVSCNTTAGSPSVYASTSNTSYNLTNLTYGQVYFVSVRSNCGEEQSAWCAETSFVAGENNATTLTVNDGSSTNEYVPFYGYYADSQTRGLFMFPASNLQSLSEGLISGMTFYASNAGDVTFNDDTWKVYVKETTESLSEYNESVFNSMTEVYSGPLSITNGMMSVPFNTTLAYNGGNLLVGFYQTYTDGTYNHTYWYGIAEGISFGGYGTSIDEQEFQPKTTFSYLPSLTPKPIDLAVTAMGMTSVTLDWTEQGSATTWEISYSTTSGDPDNGTIVPVNSHPYTFNDLVQGTTYYVSVRSINGTEPTNWSLEVSFTFGVDALTLNDGSDTNEYVPVYGYYADNGTRSLFMLQAEDLADMAYGNLTSLTFYGYGDDDVQDVSWGTDQWTVYVKETIDEFPSEYDEEIFESMTAVYSGSLAIVNGKMTINLTEPYLFQGDNLWVGIYQTVSGTYAQSYWYGVADGTSFGGYEDHMNTYTFQPKVTLDYEIGEAPSCLPVSDLAITDNEDNAVTLSWRERGTATSWEIEYGLEGFAHGNGTSVTVTTNPYTVSGLTEGTTVFYVRAVCDAANDDYSEWSEPASFSLGYCEPNPTGVDNSGITNVTFGTGDYIVNNNESPTAAPYYGNYSSMVGANTASYQTTVEITYATNYTYGTVIWVDWNNNFLFEDSEIVYTGESDNDSPTTLTASFFIPASTAAGDYRMRIAGADSYFDAFVNGDATAAHDPCFESDYAICHDYTLRVFAATAPITKTIEGYGNGTDKWYLISSPLNYSVTPTQVDGMITDDLGSDVTSETATYDLYRFDQTQELEWINYRNESFSLEPGEGYLYASKEGTTLSFAGMPYSGDGQVTLSMEDGDWSGWNLIGNPFVTEATLDMPFYKMNGTGDGFTAKIEDLTNTIAAMEGVFVQATEDGQSATFTQQTRGERSNAIAHANIKVNHNGAIIDNAIVRFDGGQTLGKFQLNPNSTKVYFTEGNHDFAIVRSAAQGEMPFNFKAESNGTYTIAIDVENVEMDYLHLIDNMTGADVDLLHPNAVIAGEDPQSPAASYTFEAKTSDYASRFKLVFNASSVSSDDSFAYFNGSNFVIANDGEATLQVVDVMGRIISSETISGNTEVSLNQTPGVYMLRLINGESVKVQKVVVR